MATHLTNDAADDSAIYLEHLRDVLADENTRYDRVLARAESLTRTTLTALTIMLAVVALLTRIADAPRFHVAAWVCIAFSAVFGAVSVAISTIVQIKSAEFMATSMKTVRDMASEGWMQDDARQSRFVVANLLHESIKKIRQQTNRKSWWLDIALWLELAFLAFMVAAFAVQMCVG